MTWDRYCSVCKVQQLFKRECLSQYSSNCLGRHACCKLLSPYFNHATMNRNARTDNILSLNSVGEPSPGYAIMHNAFTISC